MNGPGRIDAEVESYLSRIRVGLRGLPEREIEGILLELRGHIGERLELPGSSVDGVLQALGEPSTIVRQYRVENVLERAECGQSPITVLYSLYLLRRRGVAAFAVALVAGLGFAWALLLCAASVEKLLTPKDVGLWLVPGRWMPFLITVDGRGPDGSKELLGWWFVPVGLAAGVLLLLATNRFGLWWIRRSRRPVPVVPGA
jgi:hypothetical protein